ncbi:hypothetical protein HZC31_04065 [Candidatus Woesearchaeota archaeon]|nr:hypothetical protein [Candidatus Woesearchaeota archaeon]
MNIEVLLGIEPTGVEDGKSLYNLELEVKNRRYTARLSLERAELHIVAMNVLSVIEGNSIRNPIYVFNWKGEDEKQRASTIASLTEMLYHREAYLRAFGVDQNASFPHPEA